MSWLTYLVLFLLGLAFGSFLNVLIFRYKPEGKLFGSHLGGRSKCMSCQKQLRWYELIPLLSFGIQGGKCRSCKSKLSWQYPLVELACGLIFVFVPINLSGLFAFWNAFHGPVVFWLMSAVWIIALMSLLLAFVIDFKYYVIPNSATILIFLCGVAWTLLGTLTDIFQNIYGGSFLKNFGAVFPSFGGVGISHLVGVAVGLLFLLLIVFVSRGRAMGMGDVKIMAALGLLFGWPDIILIIALSFILGTIVAIPLLIWKRKKITDMLPFGPFIVISAFIIFFFGAGLLSTYFGIIGM